MRLTADIFFGHQLGAATAALGAGAVHTWLGNYGMAFLTSGLLCLLAAGLVLRIGYARPRSAGPLVPAEVGAAV